jgi:ribosomal protein S18 acetylase RimI-like enzyme
MVSVRRASKDDLPRLAPLAADLVRLHHRWDPKRFFITDRLEEGYRWFLGTQLERKDVIVLIAEHDGEIAGYLYGAIEERDWQSLRDECGAIHDILVADKFRKQGVAKALMAAGIAELKKLGAPRVVLMTAESNVEGQKLFASLGFRRTMIEMTLEL